MLSGFAVVSHITVDMEWLKGSQAVEMEVDIGYMPQMELRGTGPSRPATWEGKDMRNAFKPELAAAEDELDDLEWSREVQVDVCTRAMDIVFYPFQKVTLPHSHADLYEYCVHLVRRAATDCRFLTTTTQRHSISLLRRINSSTP